ncbi:ATP-binding cassette domain-containing protein [Marinomonas atlantica]|uniref:ATP-binding cassette domain-containing protein n=1 Tax=Marinomonas atlantica TaxID=1806668 RepID=UPI000832110B|nr:ATP-binding cassette domain-containing protein [Marinomonas atlantica]MCO4787024.1 ATP-binding cassette domain-containing protein [Marinomonas atlantica]
MLTLQSIFIESPNGVLINTLSETVNQGECLVLMGPSGVGKSSLLGYVSGTLPRALTGRGEIWLQTRRIDNLPAEQRHLGLLQQSPLLFPHMTVEENLLFALDQKALKTERRQIVNEKLNEIGLPGYGSRLPQELSGGQQARLALLRTLLSNPRALLLDEPFSKLDQTLRQEMRALVGQCIKEANIPAILVTHDKDDAQALGNMTIELTSDS